MNEVAQPCGKHWYSFSFVQSDSLKRKVRKTSDYYYLVSLVPTCFSREIYLMPGIRSLFFWFKSLFTRSRLVYYPSCAFCKKVTSRRASIIYALIIIPRVIAYSGMEIFSFLSTPMYYSISICQNFFVEFWVIKSAGSAYFFFGGGRTSPDATEAFQLLPRRHLSLHHNGKDQDWH